MHDVFMSACMYVVCMHVHVMYNCTGMSSNVMMMYVVYSTYVRMLSHDTQYNVIVVKKVVPYR